MKTLFLCVLVFCLGLVWVNWNPSSPVAPAPEDDVSSSGTSSSGDFQPVSSQGNGVEQAGQVDSTPHGQRIQKVGDGELWWENNDLHQTYLQAFQSSFSLTAETGDISEVEEKLIALDKKLKAVGQFGLSHVGWAELGEFDDGIDLGRVFTEVTAMTSFSEAYFPADRSKTDPELQEYLYKRARKNPYRFPPIDVLSSIAGKRLTLTKPQHKELEGIYWSHLGERARSEHLSRACFEADLLARRAIGASAGKILDIDYLPSQSASVVQNLESNSESYYSFLLSFAARHGLTDN